MTERASELRAELVQLRPAKGRVEQNLSRIRDRIRASEGVADLLVFPECVLSGYFVEGGVGEVSRSSSEVAEGLGRPGTNAPEVVLGFYEDGGGPTYNTVAWFAPDGDRYRVVHRHRKTFLPTYGIFDEARFVSPGDVLKTFATRFGRVGLLVCEEMLHSVAPLALALDGAELLVVVAASPVRGFRPGPARPGSLEQWDVAGRSVAQEHGLHVAISHLVGSEGGKVFSGGSTFYFPGGEIGPRGPLFDEGGAFASLDLTRVRRFRARSPLLANMRSRLPHLIASLSERSGGAGQPDRQDEESGRAVPSTGLPDPEDDTPLELDLPLVETLLIRFLRDEVVERRGFRDVVVGLSGGVDSAVSLLLAAKALGREHVHAFMLPYATSSAESRTHAEQVLDVAGVDGRVIPITPSVDAYIDSEEPRMSDLRRGNVAARFRALVLWDQSARLGALPLGTGNKSERLLGYFTWHADDSPPINPLGDLFKTQVWALARHLGVPDVVIEKAPSADLIRDVHDEDELGVGYEVADRILHWLIEGYQPQDLIRAGFPESSVEKVSQRLSGTHWKRELPTVATLSESAIGEFYLRPVDY